MKKTLLLLVLLISATAFCQVPQGISYQAIATNASGNPIVSANVGVRLSILDNSASGTLLYSETQTRTTNAQGLFNLVIGQGTATSGTFAGINWGTNVKFLKVEMDTAGGTNYALVGTTQLLSVPYALAADSLVTSAGEGITLVSPNGTPYTITVNDAGQLSLPTSSNVGGNLPAVFYVYGSFNGFDASTALLMGTNPLYFSVRDSYKYYTTGTQLKFVTQNNAGSPVYGINGANELVVNGNAYTIPSNGFYLVSVGYYPADPNPMYILTTPTSIAPTLNYYANGNSQYANPTYTVGTNTFTFIANGVTSEYPGFQFTIPSGTGSGPFGDNLADGSIEYQGNSILFPNTSATPKNYRVTLVLNFNGSGTYTVVQI